MNNNEITTTAEMTADNTMYTKEEKNMNSASQIEAYLCINHGDSKGNEP